MALGPKVGRRCARGCSRCCRTAPRARPCRRCAAALTPQVAVEYTLPVRGQLQHRLLHLIHHARNVGQFIRPDSRSRPTSSGCHCLPRQASSVVVKRHGLPPAWGQALPPGASAPVHGPARGWTTSWKMAIYVGRAMRWASPLPLARAERHIFGMGLLNDWSARDHQFWEMAPLAVSGQELLHQCLTPGW